MPNDGWKAIACALNNSREAWEGTAAYEQWVKTVEEVAKACNAVFPSYARSQFMILAGYEP